MRKILLMLVSAALLAVIVFLFRPWHTKVSLGKIDSELASPQLTQPQITDRLRQVLETFRRQKTPEAWLEKSDIEIARQSFLSRRDSALIEKLQVLKSRDHAEQMEFFSASRYSLYRAITHALTEIVRLRFTNPRDTVATARLVDTCRWAIQHFPEQDDRRFLQHELQFHTQLGKSELRAKLRLERLIREISKRLDSDPRSVQVLMGEALRLARQLHDQKLELDILTRLQFILNEGFGFTNIALRLGDQIIERAHRLGYLIKSAVAHYYRGNSLIDQGRFEEALQEFQTAQALYKSFHNARMVSKLYERQGVVLRRLGRFSEALASYRNARATSSEMDPLAEFRYLQGLGLVYEEQGHFRRADSLYTKSLKVAQSVQDTISEATAWANLGSLHLDLGAYDRAIEDQRQTLRLLGPDGNPHMISESWTHMAEAYILKHDFPDAKMCTDKAAEILARFDFGLLKAERFLTVGNLRLQFGDVPAARRSFEQALALFRQLDVPDGQIRTHNLLAEASRRLGEFRLAKQNIDAALALADQTQSHRHLWASYFYLGRIYRNLADLRNAEHFLGKAVDAARELTGELNNYRQRYSFSQKIQPLFEEMILVQLQKRDERAALAFAEQERAQVFKLLLQSRRQGLVAATKPLFSSLSLNIRNTLQDAADLVSELQQTLDGQTVLVEYEVTDETLVIWVISRDSFDTATLELARSRIDSMVTAFRNCVQPDSLATPHGYTASYRRSKALSRLLYEKLIAPVGDKLAGYRLVCFVPDEKLNYLPFAAFRDESDKFLIERTALAMLPSSEILVQQLRTVKKRPRFAFARKLLAVAANPDLPYAEKEARTVAGLDPHSELLVGDRVTENLLRRKLAEKIDVLLVSNHSRIDERTPSRSALLLNVDQAEPREEGNDGFLSAGEIQELDLRSMELVFLSVCESASGRLYRGEGIVGMQRAFLLAGAETVVANLWKIDDQSARDITVDFFRLWLGNALSKAEALRQAQMEEIRRLRSDAKFDYKAHPFFWAAPVLTGALD